MPQEQKTEEEQKTELKFWWPLALFLLIYATLLIFGIGSCLNKWGWQTWWLPTQPPFDSRAYEVLSVFANAASAVGLILTIAIFLRQKRDSARALDKTVGELQGTKRDLDEAIKRLGQEIVALKDVPKVEEAISMLKGWFTENADRKLTHFWWRSGYSVIPVFWADAEKCAEVVRLICAVDHDGVSLTGPEADVFEGLATLAADALLRGVHLTNERVKRWKDDHATKAPIKEQIMEEYNGLIRRCSRAKPGGAGEFPGLRNLKSTGVNWAIAKFERAGKDEFEIIVFRDKTTSEEPRFLAEPTIHKTNNPTLAELIIQEFKPLNQS